MLKLLRKLIGADSGTGSAPESAKPRSATSEVLMKGVRLQGEASASKSAAQAPEFDPYNTGAFDRGSSWERIGKR
jgi:hypothetical protein